MRVDVARRLLSLKIVYYGPGKSGKTTNLLTLHSTFNAAHRGEMVQLDTETERTLFFDYFPVVVGRLGGFRVKVDFFTVPGQSFYVATRRAVLDAADGVVFVADSSPDREDANLQSKQDMVDALAAMGRTLDLFPHVYQWNKRDVPKALATKLLARQLNPEKVEAVEAAANSGVGVMETQSAIFRAVVDRVKSQFAGEGTLG